MATRLVLVHALSPLHAGTGQSVGAIDLPIAREKPTGIPLVPGSSLKGALRARSDASQITFDAFGPITEKASDHAGSVQFSDLHVIFFPVRSVAGTFAWVTSPYLLRRLLRDARAAGRPLPGDLPVLPDSGTCHVLRPTLTLPFDRERRLVLEDLDFKPMIAEAGADLALLAEEIARLVFPDSEPDADSWRESFFHRFCLVHDDAMTHVLETATEVTARVRLEPETKTVTRGALWYEEALPAESILAGLAVAADVTARNGRQARTAGELLEHVEGLTQGMVQLGGKANVGRGSCLVLLAGGAA